MFFLTVDCDAFQNEEKAAVVVPVRYIEVKETSSKAYLLSVLYFVVKESDE